MEKLVECPICCAIKRNKKYFLCVRGHSLCEDCYSGIEAKICPECRQGFNFPLTRNFNVETMIKESNDIIFECIHDNCLVSATRKEIEKHELEECPEGSKYCCGQIYFRKNQAQHLKNFHHLKCPNKCSFKGNAQEVASHLERSCPKSVVQCPNCTDSMERCQMSRHYNTAHLPCMNVNCSVAGTREEMKIEPLEYTTSCTHPGRPGFMDGSVDISIWNSAEWKSDPFPTDITCMSLLGETLYIGGEKGLFGMMDLQELKFKRVVSKHYYEDILCADNNGVDRLIIADEDGKVSLWDTSQNGRAILENIIFYKRLEHPAVWASTNSAKLQARQTAADADFETRLLQRFGEFLRQEPVELAFKSLGDDCTTMARFLNKDSVIVSIVSFANASKFLIVDVSNSSIAVKQMVNYNLGDLFKDPCALTTLDSKTFLIRGDKGFINVFKHSDQGASSSWIQSCRLQLPNNDFVHSIFIPSNDQKKMIVGYRRNENSIIDEVQLPDSFVFENSATITLQSTRIQRVKGSGVYQLGEIDGMMVARVGGKLMLFSSTSKTTLVDYKYCKLPNYRSGFHFQVSPDFGGALFHFDKTRKVVVGRRALELKQELEADYYEFVF